MPKTTTATTCCFCNGKVGGDDKRAHDEYGTRAYHKACLYKNGAGLLFQQLSEKYRLTTLKRKAVSNA